MTLLSILGNKVGQKYRQWATDLSTRYLAGDKSLITQIENNFTSNGPIQQICRSELNLQKTSTGKRQLEDLEIEEKQVKLLKMRSDIAQQERKSEAEAKEIECK